MAGTRFAFLVDGSKGFAAVESVVGGEIRARVRADNTALGPRPRKRIEARSYEPFVVQVGLDGTEGLLAWLSETWEHGSVLKSGEVHAVDEECHSLSARQFFSGLIQEVEIPACDAGSNDVNHISLKIEPQGFRLKAGGGEKLKVVESEKPWFASHFRASVEGLPSGKISKVDALVWRQTVASGSTAPTVRSPANAVIEVPNVRMTMPISDWSAWFDWCEVFLLGGNSGTAREKDGEIEFLGPDRQELFAKIDLLGLGPVTLEPPAAEAAGAVPTFSVEMYCQDMRFSLV